MEAFGEERYSWLKTKLELPCGIPSHDTFNRVFQMIDPKQLKHALQSDGASLLQHIEEELIVLDGKKLRGASARSPGNTGLYMLHAWVSDIHLCIGQLKVEDKSNEITAIPVLLSELSIAGATVSIDAIGCQKHIAEQIVEQQANYILALKSNQEELLEEVRESFHFSPLDQTSQEWEYGHGRFEKRHCAILKAGDCLSPDMQQMWPSIKTLIKIEANRMVNDVSSTQTRFYISSLSNKSALDFNRYIRSHWSIENQLHWHLDVTFREDANRTRTANAPENLSIMRKIALHRVAKDDSKLSKRKRRYKAAMNLEYLEKILKL